MVIFVGSFTQSTLYTFASPYSTLSIDAPSRCVTSEEVIILPLNVSITSAVWMFVKTLSDIPIVTDQPEGPDQKILVAITFGSWDPLVNLKLGLIITEPQKGVP